MAQVSAPSLVKQRAFVHTAELFQDGFQNSAAAQSEFAQDQIMQLRSFQ